MGQGPVNNPMATGSMPGPTNQPSQPMNPIERMIFNTLYRVNPQFRQLADEVSGMTPEQAFQAKGQDYSQYQNVNSNQVRQMLGL